MVFLLEIYFQSKFHANRTTFSEKMMYAAICSKYAANMQHPIIFSTSTPSGIFCHAKNYPFTNFHALCMKIILHFNIDFKRLD